MFEHLIETLTTTFFKVDLTLHDSNIHDTISSDVVGCRIPHHRSTSFLLDQNGLKIGHLKSTLFNDPTPTPVEKNPGSGPAVNSLAPGSEAKGPDSQHPTNGATGEQQANGTTGEDQANGASGKHQANGATGEHSANGATGEQQANGATGEDQANGATGKHQANAGTSETSQAGGNPKRPLGQLEKVNKKLPDGESNKEIKLVKEPSKASPTVHEDKQQTTGHQNEVLIRKAPIHVVPKEKTKDLIIKTANKNNLNTTEEKFTKEKLEEVQKTADDEEKFKHVVEEKNDRAKVNELAGKVGNETEHVKADSQNRPLNDDQLNKIAEKVKDGNTDDDETED